MTRDRMVNNEEVIDHKEVTHTRPGANPPAVENLLRLQRLAGNGAVSRAIGPPAPPPQLTSGENLLGVRIGISPDLIEMVDPVGANPKLYVAPDNIPVGNLKYSRFPGQAFVKGAGDADAVDPNDVTQGSLGDCYLMAAMMAVARVNPGKIKSLIHRQTDGTYNVTLHLRRSDNTWVESTTDTTTVNVVPEFPTLNGKPYYAAGGDSDKDGPELWAMLIEKAYAQVMGGYRGIKGGDDGDAMTLLTGAGIDHIDVGSTKPADLIKQVSQAITAHMAVTCASRDWQPTDTHLDKLGAQLGVPPNHSFAVTSIDVNAGMITVQNPYGTDAPVVTLKVDGSFAKLFEYINIAKV